MISFSERKPRKSGLLLFVMLSFILKPFQKKDKTPKAALSKLTNAEIEEKEGMCISRDTAERLGSPAMILEYLVLGRCYICTLNVQKEVRMM